MKLEELRIGEAYKVNLEKYREITKQQNAAPLKLKFVCIGMISNFTTTVNCTTLTGDFLLYDAGESYGRCQCVPVEAVEKIQIEVSDKVPDLINVPSKGYGNMDKLKTINDCSPPQPCGRCGCMTPFNELIKDGQNRMVCKFH